MSDATQVLSQVASVEDVLRFGEVAFGGFHQPVAAVAEKDQLGVRGQAACASRADELREDRVEVIVRTHETAFDITVPPGLGQSRVDPAIAADFDVGCDIGPAQPPRLDVLDHPQHASVHRQKHRIGAFRARSFGGRFVVAVQPMRDPLRATFGDGRHGRRSHRHPVVLPDRRRSLRERRFGLAQARRTCGVKVQAARVDG